jgi:hypothetical protein
MNTSGAAPIGQHTCAGGDAQRWQEAARLRGEHPRWVIVWLAESGEFHAYARLPGARRDTALAASSTDDLAAQIDRAEQVATTRSARRGRSAS